MTAHDAMHTVAGHMHRLWRGAHVALALVLSFFAVTPHQHEGLREELFRDALVEIGHCHEPAALHMHAAQLAREHPCVACARQHTNATLRAVGKIVVRPVVGRAIATVAALATSPSVVFTPLRGPPA